MLSSLRFVTLFTIGSRGGVAELIAAVGDDGEPRSGTARLLTDSQRPARVTVAFAPRRSGPAIDGVVALILADELTRLLDATCCDILKPA